MPAKPLHQPQMHLDDLAAQYTDTAEEEESYIENLQRESAYLTAKLQNEMDDVRKIEVSMTEITTMLMQFADLVAEQHEDVTKVGDNTRKSKKNVEKGQEQLVAAAQKGKESKHRMATLIVVMALVLLFVNYITP